MTTLPSYRGAFLAADHTGIVRAGFAPAFHTGVVPGRGARVFLDALRAGDLAHGVVEGEAEDLDVEVNGVAGQVALGPAPDYEPAGL